MEIAQLQAFVETLERGSILAASEALGVSAATIRARLDALEAELGLTLLVRSNRGVEPTEQGAAFEHGARRLIRDAEALVATARRDNDEVIGELCTMGPAGSLPPMMSVVVAMELRRRYPKLKLRYLSSEHPIQDAGPEVDVILHFGEAHDEGFFRTYALGRFPVCLLASASYLDERGRPTRVEDLAQHDLLCWEKPAGDGSEWPLLAGGSFEVQPAIRSTDVLRLRFLATAGLGIALLPDSPLARGTVPGEDLEIVLPEVVGREGALRILIRESSAGAGRTVAIKKLFREISEGMFGVISDDYLRSRQS